MRIAIDASRTTVARVTGTEHYAIELIRALIRRNTGHRITLYFRDAPAPDLFPASPLVETQVLPQRRLWTHLAFAAALRRDRPDVTFVPAHSLPLAFPGPAVVTVHDLGFRHFPQAHPWWPRAYLNWSTGYSARRASLVLVDSDATGDDLTRLYGTPPAKIRTVYPGVEPPAIGDVDTVRRKYELPDRYFLFLGTLQPRKNIARIVQAYVRWRAVQPEDSAGLVLAGGKGWLYDPAWTDGVAGVVMPGYVDDADKGALYAGALALVFPSLYEGFGFPALEAMRCGTPVIVSSVSSLPELAGEAALRVDPLDVEAIASAMSRLTSDQPLRASLVEKGRLRASAFTWERTARQTMLALEQAATER